MSQADPQPRFTWKPFYRELAVKLVPYRDRQVELINFLDGLRSKGLAVTPLDDKDESGQRHLLREIDPFTFFGVFNRGISDKNRKLLLEEVKRFFGVEAAVPEDFSGIPILNNQRSWFFSYAPNRHPDDVPKLWRVFELGLGSDPLSRPEFAEAFDGALAIRGVNVNLTMGLFWVNPDVFLSVDSVMRDFAILKLPPKGLQFGPYVSMLEEVRRQHPVGFLEVSHQAWLASQKTPPPPPLGPSPPIDITIDYWLVGAYWDDREPADQTETFLREGIWQNGYTDKFTDLVRQMKVGDRIAIKTSTTQKEGLPFDGRGKTVSRNTIKATGTITANNGDGRTVEVEWDPLPAEPRAWYFYTGRNTVWRLRKDDEFAQRLIRFAFYGEPQDYEFFVRRWWDDGGGVVTGGDPPNPPYSVDTALSDGVFLSKAEFVRALERLEAKRNIILEGPPGVGKTFVADKLAFALMESLDPSRVTKVQFHPSYSYEDFVRGFRPTDVAAKFSLADGPFLRACQAAAAQPDLRHVLIIDEINRANTSQVFGELLMLLEADKRDLKPGVTLLYPRSADERFAVPRNLFVIGTMNRADRSLALVDYALRRRFAFIALTPRFGDPVFRSWLRNRGMDEALVQHVIQRMNALNASIEGDRQLGREFRIGHSFFCPRGDDFSKLTISWFRGVVETEIVPLLEEYWFGFPEKISAAVDALLAP